MNTLVGKNTQLKQAAVVHAIMQAVGQRAAFAPTPIKYVLVCNCT